MKLIQLMEMPLPKKWDKNKINFEYALERAEKIGDGSARVVVSIPYNGRPSALKVAKGVTGLIQNEGEIRAYKQYDFAKFGLVIPMIDYDTVNNPPRWIHFYKASPITKNDIKRISNGASINDIVEFASVAAFRNLKKDRRREFPEVDPKNAFVKRVVNFINKTPDIPSIEFTDITNWGLYRGRPVIIDMGLTNSSANHLSNTRDYVENRRKQ